MKRWRTVCLVALAVLVSLTGCGEWDGFRETLTQTISAEETTLPQPLSAEETTMPESIPVLTLKREPENICVMLRPTDVVVEGEDCRYYTPEDQEVWLAAYEAAIEAADPERRWQEGDSGSGIFLFYQEEWWELLACGDLVGRGRISAADCKELTVLIRQAVENLGMEQPVRPSQLQGIRSATLDWNGKHTLTDPEKLSRLEQWLTGSWELHGGAQCWFTARLTLELENGQWKTIAMATDNCATWLSEGVFYQYDWSGNEEFYALFTEPTQEAAPMEYTPEGSDMVMVRVSDHIPGILQELRYATEDNFTGQVIYDFTEAYLRYGTLEKLQKVQQELEEQGLGLKIWDGFRPVSAQFRLWEVYPDASYVADPNKGYSNHSRGNTVDVTLVDAQGNALPMPTDFDDFTHLADRDYSDVEEQAADNARLLQQTMEKYGFEGYYNEWWHFTDEEEYPVEESFRPVAAGEYAADCQEFITLRTQPDTGARAITKILKDERFTRLAVSGDFAYVDYQGMRGYVLESYIRPLG